MRGFRGTFAQEVLPFLSSLAVHASIVILAVMAARVIVYVVPPSEEQTTPADGRLANDIPGVVLNPGQNADDLRKMMQDVDPDTTDKTGISDHKGASAQLTVAAGGAGEGEPAELIAPGAEPSGRGKGSGLGMGDRWGRGNGADGPLAAFGPRTMGGKSGIFRPPEVRRVAYVCDASGSMISKMAILRDELSKAVLDLKAVQAFNVIFFQDAQYAAWDAGALQLATVEHKRNAVAFLDNVTPAGATNPIPGLELAFRQQPELIFLLTDGDFIDNKAVLQRINELNKARKVRINTIAFVSDADRDQDFLELLRQIAKTHGGTFRHVRDTDLNR